MPRFKVVACPVMSEDGVEYETHLVLEDGHTLSQVIEGRVIPTAECINQENADMIVRCLNLRLN